ncbi:MAG TPA: hypothetical protein VIK71_10700 [Flavobacteriales bacterium]
MRKYCWLTVLVGVGLMLTLSQCRKESFITDSSAMLEFSRDTIFFDTIFTNVGSTTQYLKVRNKHNQSIRISEISIENGIGSQFRINVDGDNGLVHRDIEILPNDSIHVFVEVTIDPNNAETPFIVEDNIRFVTNGNVQKVNLVAWGQNAYFHGGLNSCNQPISEVITGNVVWPNDKPHVVYGILAVAPDAKLTIQAGTNVYFHSKSGIYVDRGTLVVQGTIDNKVIFQGDRLEAAYADVPGQWGIQLDCPIETGVGPAIASVIRGGIWLYQTKDSYIEYAVIKNGNMGIQVDTTGYSYESSNFALRIKNTEIRNMAGIGLWGQGATIRGENLLISNCGQASAYLGIGGKYQMDNCTFGNYWSGNKRNMPAFVLNNYYEDINENIHVRPLINCFFNNCIMYGANAQLSDFDEFVVDVWPDNEAEQQYIFRYCLVDTDADLSNSLRYENMVAGLAPFFVAPASYDFHVSQSNPRMWGQSLPGSPMSDLDGVFPTEYFYKGCYHRP